MSSSSCLTQVDKVELHVKLASRAACHIGISSLKSSCKGELSCHATSSLKDELSCHAKSSYNLSWVVKSSLKASCKHMHSVPNSNSLFSPSCAYYTQSSTPLHHSLVMQRKSGGKETVCKWTRVDSVWVCYLLFSQWERAVLELIYCSCYTQLQRQQSIIYCVKVQQRIFASSVGL